MRFGDSATVPRGVGTFGSRSVAMAGSAIVVAIEKLVEAARPVAARLLDVDPGTVVLRAAGRLPGPDGGPAISWQELARAAYRPERLPAGMEVGLRVVRALSIAAGVLLGRLRGGGARSSGPPGGCGCDGSPPSTTPAR